MVSQIVLFTASVSVAGAEGHALAPSMAWRRLSSLPYSAPPALFYLVYLYSTTLDDKPARLVLADSIYINHLGEACPKPTESTFRKKAYQFFIDFVIGCTLQNARKLMKLGHRAIWA